VDVVFATPVTDAVTTEPEIELDVTPWSEPT
jgi:hypothetical protein